MDQIIRCLAGKRFGLMGFDAPEGDSIIGALAAARGIGHVIGAEPLIPGLNSFSPFDACFINASAIGRDERPAPIEMIAHSRKPAIIVGSSTTWWRDSLRASTSTENSFCGRARRRNCCSGLIMSSDSSRPRKPRTTLRLQTDPGS